MKSFKPKQPPSDDGERGGGRNPPADFRDQKRSNETHRSTTDPDAQLYRKGPGMEARLCFIGHGLMENRCGLIVDARLTRVSGHAERLAALDMMQHVANRPCAITLGADRGYDAADFVEELRGLNVRPHVAQNTSGRRSAIDRRTTRHPGYAASQRIRKRIEAAVSSMRSVDGRPREAFGWIKGVGGLRQTKLRGLPKVDWAFTFAAAAYNLVRVPELMGATHDQARAGLLPRLRRTLADHRDGRVGRDRPARIRTHHVQRPFRGGSRPRVFGAVIGLPDSTSSCIGISVRT
jgi:hypothetical protein